jgi:hypothetical protein
LLPFSASVFAGSLCLGIGTVQSPGIGFVAFVALGLLGILSHTHALSILQPSAKRIVTKSNRFFLGHYGKGL